MSLATSCPSCGTIFKVVEDQLKVSEGWVRCGHCHEVFNALEGLFDLAGRQRPQIAPRPAGTGEFAPRRVSTATPPSNSTPLPRTDQRPPDTPADWIETRPAMFSDVEALRSQRLERDAERLKHLAAQDAAARFTDAQASPDSPPIDASSEAPAAPAGAAIESASVDESSPIDAPHAAQALPADSETEFIDLGAADTIFQPHEQNTLFDDSLGACDPLPPVDDEADGRGLGAWRPDAHDDGPAAMPPVAPAPVVEPSGAAALPAFIRQADRAAWWRKPMVRMLLALGCALAAAALLLQLTLHHRDSLAVRWPVLHAPLSALCAELGCTLQAPRQLDALVVENTALTRPAGVDGYRLQVLLRNRVDFAILAPHLELSLTDSSGAVIVRRVLSPADFRQGDTLSASAEGNWQLELGSNDKRIAGYTVSAFYP